MSRAVRAFFECLRPGGIALVGIRDYATENDRTTPQMRPCGFREHAGHRYFVFQTRDVRDDGYEVAMYFVREADVDHPPTVTAGTSRHYVVHVDELVELFGEAGFERVRRLDGVMHPPLVVGRRPVDKRCSTLQWSAISSSAGRNASAGVAASAYRVPAHHVVELVRDRPLERLAEVVGEVRVVRVHCDESRWPRAFRTWTVHSVMAASLRGSERGRVRMMTPESGYPVRGRRDGSRARPPVRASRRERSRPARPVDRDDSRRDAGRRRRDRRHPARVPEGLPALRAVRAPGAGLPRLGARRAARLARHVRGRVRRRGGRRDRDVELGRRVVDRPALWSA